MGNAQCCDASAKGSIKDNSEVDLQAAFANEVKPETEVKPATPAATPSSTPAPAAGKPEFGVFTITVNKEAGAKMGIGLKDVEGKVKVVNVGADGIVGAFNKINPGSALQLGDTVLEVNGTGGAAPAITDVIKNATGKVVMKCQRPTSAPAGAPAAAAPAAAPASAAAPAAAPAGGPAKFTVDVDKTGGSKLGMGLDKKPTGLGVLAVNDGLIADWNKANPGSKVETGDMILSANGTAGSGEAIIGAIQAATGKLALEIQKPPAKMTKGAQWTVTVKKGAEGYGFGIQTNSAGVTMVGGIKDGKSVDAYNKANPATAIMVGDTLLEANGQKTDMAKVFQTSDEVTMKMTR